METLLCSTSNETMNLEMWNLLENLYLQDDITDFLRSEDPFSMSKIGFICILKWNIVLEKYENILLRYRNTHFFDNIQIKPFERIVKTKILLIFKFLINIMKNTFNHELYTIDDFHTDYLNSYDLDVAYNSFVFHNEYYNGFSDTFNEKSQKHLCLENFSFYSEKNVFIDQIKDCKNFHIMLSYKENRDLGDFKNKIQDYFKSHREQKIPINLYEFHTKFESFSACKLQISRYIYYGETDSPKLLQIEILANILTAKLYFTFKLELLLFCMQNFLSTTSRDILLDSLYIFTENILLIPKCKYKQEDLISNRDFIKKLLQDYQEFLFEFPSEKEKKIYTKFLMILNFLYSDSEIPQIYYLSGHTFKFIDICRFLPHILNILYNNVFLSKFVNEIFLKSNTMQLIESLFDFIDPENTNKPIYFDNIDKTNIYYDYKDQVTWLFELYTKIIIYILNNVMYEKHEGFISFFLEKACLVTKNYFRYDFILVDFINKNIIEILSKINSMNVSETEVTTLKTLFDYYTCNEICYSVTAFSNILYLSTLISGSRLYFNFLDFIQKLSNLYFKNLKFSIFLNHFSKISDNIEDIAINYLKNYKEYHINFDSIIHNLSLKKAHENINMNDFMNLKKFCTLKVQANKIYTFLKKNDKNTLQRFFYDEFHLFFYLKFIGSILPLKNIVITTKRKNNLHKLINIPKKCYKKENIYLLKSINRIAFLKINPNISNSIYMNETTLLDISEFQTLISNASYTHFFQTVSPHEILFGMMVGLEYISTDFEYSFDKSDIISKYELVKKHFEFVNFLYKKIILIYKPEYIPCFSMEITDADFLRHCDNIDEGKDFIESLIKYIYVLILKNIIFLEKMPRVMYSKDDPSKHISYVDLFCEISSNTFVYDLNLISLYLKYFKNIPMEIFEIRLVDLIDILKVYINQLSKINSENKMVLFFDLNLILLILSEIFKKMNSLGNDLIYVNLHKILNLMIVNASLFSEYYSKIFLNIIPLYKNIEKVLSKLDVFIKIFDFITIIEKKSMNLTLDAFTIKENTRIYFFLNECFVNLYYVDFFIEAQKRFDFMFFFIYAHINKIFDLQIYFSKKPASLFRYLEILQTNINMNIEDDKNMTYKKESLFLSDIASNFNEPKEVLLYLISLINFANYSKNISKMEIYRYCKAKIGFRFCENNIGLILNNTDQIFEYGYTCLRNLFEDEFYLISSFVYVIDCYTKLPKNISEYFNQKFIYKSELNSKDNIFSSQITEDDINLKIEILNDMILIINQKPYLYRIITLQFLSELISTFPFLLPFVKKETIDGFFDNFISPKILDDFISLDNCSRWYLNFRYGYFITVSLYRGDLFYVDEVIGKICFLLKMKDFNLTYNLFSLVYKILISEICCCKYIQYLNRKNHDFHDKNCKFTLEKRKKEIFRIFLSKDILETLVTKYEQNLCSNTHIINLQNLLLKLLNIFLSYINRGNTNCFEKYLMSSIFECYSPDSHNIFCPTFFSEIKYFNIYEIIFSEESDSFENINISFMELTKLRNIDFGYIMKYHIGIGASSGFKKIAFDCSEINSQILNFYAENINDIKIVIEISVLKNNNETIEGNLKNKLKRYNLPKDVLEKVNSKLFSSKKKSNHFLFDAKKDSNIFNYDDFICKNYVSKIYKSKDWDETKNSHRISIFPSINSDVKKICYNLLIDLYILPISEYAYELIKIIRKIIFFNLDTKFDENFIKFYFTHVSRLKSMAQDSNFDKKLENTENAFKYVCNQTQAYSEDIVLEFLLFESLFLKINTDRLPIDLVKLKSIQNSLITSASKSNNVGQNILYQILYRQKNEIDSTVFYFFNIYFYYFEKISLFLLKGSFTEKETILRVKYFFYGYDGFLNSFNMNSISFERNFMAYISDFFDYMATNPLNTFFIDFIDYKNELIVFLFEKYLEIIAKYCQVYLYIRNQIYNDMNLMEYRNLFVYNDFICFIFGISASEISSQNSEQINELILFFIKLKTIFEDSSHVFLSFQYMSLETKMMVFSRITSTPDPFSYPALSISINRNDIVESTIEFLKHESLEDILCENWIVTFVNEDGGGIGPLHEFFFMYGKAINENIYFAPFRTLGFVKIVGLSNDINEKIERLYYYTGIIMAKSVLKNSVMGIEFTDLLYLFLVRQKFSVADLENIDPEFHKNILSLRDVEDLDSLCLNFSILVKVGEEIHTFDLIENGSNINVGKENLEEYIQIITEFKIYKGMKVFLDKLKEGFNLIVSDYFDKLFSYNDLRMILEGKKELNITEWKAATEYGDGYSSEHQIIIWFWNFVTELDESGRHKLFFFITGLNKLPIGGLQSLKFKNNPLKIGLGGSENSLPTAYTCLNLLKLPLYYDENTFKEKMKAAIEVKYYGLA